MAKRPTADFDAAPPPAVPAAPPAAPLPVRDRSKLNGIVDAAAAQPKAKPAEPAAPTDVIEQLNIKIPAALKEEFKVFCVRHKLTAAAAFEQMFRAFTK